MRLCREIKEEILRGPVPCVDPIQCWSRINFFRPAQPSQLGVRLKRAARPSFPLRPMAGGGAVGARASPAQTRPLRSKFRAPRGDAPLPRVEALPAELVADLTDPTPTATRAGVHSMSRRAGDQLGGTADADRRFWKKVEEDSTLLRVLKRTALQRAPLECRAAGAHHLVAAAAPSRATDTGHSSQARAETWIKVHTPRVKGFNTRVTHATRVKGTRGTSTNNTGTPREPPYRSQCAQY